MKKFAQAASVLALTAVTMSASAWWGQAPTCMTEEQKQAMAEQQAKAMENAMAAQRQFAEQQAAAAKRYAEQAPATGPFGGNPFAYQQQMPEFPAMPEMSYPQMPEMPAMPDSPLGNPGLRLRKSTGRPRVPRRTAV